MEPFAASTTAKRRAEERNTCVCFSAGLFSVILKMFLLTASHLETKHVEAVQVGDVVVMLGSSAILPCHIITNDRLSQITWQKTIKGKAPNDVFLTIQPKIGLVYSNGKDSRFEFNGNFSDKNGTLKFSNVTLKDEGSYTCIFSLFPSGTQSRNSQLVILVPPITNLMDYTPLEGNEEVPLATCTAAASKPKAEVRWIKGSLEGKVREELNETKHANGTTTTWSTLLGKPGREMKGQLVKCVISSEATKEEILETNIQVHYLPAKVNIIERSEVSFECETEANPNATVIWSRSGQPLPPSVKVVGATLQFSSQSNDLSGLYQCETRNLYGSKQAYLFVHFSSGKCTGPIIIAVFSTLLILLILAIIGLYYCHRTGKLQRFSDLWGEMRQQVQRRDPPAADTEEGLEARPLRTRSSSGQQEEEVFPGELPLLHSLPHHPLTLFCLCHGLNAPSCLLFPAYLLDHLSVPLSWVGISPGMCARQRPKNIKCNPLKRCRWNKSLHCRKRLRPMCFAGSTINTFSHPSLHIMEPARPTESILHFGLQFLNSQVTPSGIIMKLSKNLSHHGLGQNSLTQAGASELSGGILTNLEFCTCSLCHKGVYFCNSGESDNNHAAS